MGLDMYLSTRVSFSHYSGMVENGGIWAEEFPKAETLLDIAGIKPTVDGSVAVVATVAYWRKANAIHQWFVDAVQDGKDDCQEYYVEVGQLEKLISLCEEILADHALASDLLPTQEGFFFGGTEYDEWYFKDLEDTIKMLREAIDNRPQYADFYYQSSW